MFHACAGRDCRTRDFSCEHEIFLVNTNNSNDTNLSYVESFVNTKNIRVIRDIRVQKNICGLLVEHEIIVSEHE